MEEIKSYTKVNKNNDSLQFGISTMESYYIKRAGVPDVPHRHDFYTILLTKKAKGSHVIDFNKYALTGNQLFFVSPGQVHQLIETAEPIGYSIVFSIEFLIRNNIRISFIDDLKLFQDFGESPPLSLNDTEVDRMFRYAQEISEIHHSDLLLKGEALGALLKLLLIRCNNLCVLDNGAKHIETSGNALIKSFKELINTNYATCHATSDYADQLNITPDHLNRVVKSLTRKTAKDHIQSRIIVAAKRLLYFTDLSAKEISFKLGFSEPANFSAFFKKHTVLSPSKFREKA